MKKGRLRVALFFALNLSATIRIRDLGGRPFLVATSREARVLCDSQFSGDQEWSPSRSRVVSHILDETA
jgi:hypothetical protein